MTPALETLTLALHAEPSQMPPGRTLFLGATPHSNLPTGITGWQPLKPLADAWDTAGHERMDTVDGKWPLILLLPGKSRDETLAWFAIARDHLEPGGAILCSMPNSAGAGRFEKEFKKATGAVTSIQKNKCRAFHATDDGNWNESKFDEWRELTKPKPIADSHFITQPGIFSSDHIDPGSQLLADHLPKNLRGQIADLGAGWGFLSEAALTRNPNIKRIDLYEADARAIDCAKQNLAQHDRDIHYHWHDVTKDLHDTYDAIIMNPPFHTGQATDVDLGKTFITAAANSLRRGGQLFIVANRQLPYESLLDSLKFRYRKLSETPTYKLLFASKP